MRNPNINYILEKHCPPGSKVYLMNRDCAKYVFHKDPRSPYIVRKVAQIAKLDRDLAYLLKEENSEFELVKGLGLTTLMYMQDFFMEKYGKHIKLPKKMKNIAGTHTIKVSGCGSTRRNGGRYINNG